jgi:hypothetical protein
MCSALGRKRPWPISKLYPGIAWSNWGNTYPCRDSNKVQSDALPLRHLLGQQVGSVLVLNKCCEWNYQFSQLDVSKLVISSEVTNAQRPKLLLAHWPRCILINLVPARSEFDPRQATPRWT